MWGTSGTSSWRVLEAAVAGAQNRPGVRRLENWDGADAAPASSDAAGRVARASQPSRRTMGWTSGCSWPCGPGRGGGKKMARSRFTDILNAFISEADRRAGHLRSSSGLDWPRESRQLVRSTNLCRRCCAAHVSWHATMFSMSNTNTNTNTGTQQCSPCQIQIQIQILARNNVLHVKYITKYQIQISKYKTRSMEIKWPDSTDLNSIHGDCCFLCFYYILSLYLFHRQID